MKQMKLELNYTPESCKLLAAACYEMREHDDQYLLYWQLFRIYGLLLEALSHLSVDERERLAASVDYVPEVIL